MIVILFTAFCGCVQLHNIYNIFNPSKPTTTPIVTILPTPTPRPSIAVHTPTPMPSPVARQMNTSVKVMPFGDKGLIDFSFVKDTEIQRENVSVVVANDGTADARDVVLTLTVTDAHGGNALIQQKFNEGDLARGDRKECVMETENHGLASSVLIDVNVEWGENGEYYNPTTFIHVAKSIWM